MIQKAPGGQGLANFQWRVRRCQLRRRGDSSAIQRVVTPACSALKLLCVYLPAPGFQVELCDVALLNLFHVTGPPARETADSGSRRLTVRAAALGQQSSVHPSDGLFTCMAAAFVSASQLCHAQELQQTTVASRPPSPALLAVTAL